MLIDMQHIRKVYRGGMLATQALADFTLRIESAEFVSVMGPSGSGKTTFLNIAGLLDRFDSGAYRLDDVEVSALSDNQLARLRNEKIGFLFQSANLIPDLDVYANVEVPLVYRRMSPRDRDERVREVLEQLGLTARMRHYPTQLSGGQQQRVAIARAVAGRPELILADEPTGNLDAVMARQVIDTLQAINAAGTTVVMVTHAAELAARAHRRLHILDGRVIDPRARDRDGAPQGLSALLAE